MSDAREPDLRIVVRPPLADRHGTSGLVAARSGGLDSGWRTRGWWGRGHFRSHLSWCGVEVDLRRRRARAGALRLRSRRHNGRDAAESCGQISYVFLTGPIRPYLPTPLREGGTGNAEGYDRRPPGSSRNLRRRGNVVAFPLPRSRKSPPPFPEAGSLFGGWQRPTLPCGLPHSTIGADRLNCRVRDGNGCGPVALIASHEGELRLAWMDGVWKALLRLVL